MGSFVPEHKAIWPAWTLSLPAVLWYRPCMYVYMYVCMHVYSYACMLALAHILLENATIKRCTFIWTSYQIYRLDNSLSDEPWAWLSISFEQSSITSRMIVLSTDIYKICTFFSCGPSATLALTHAFTRRSRGSAAACKQHALVIFTYIHALAKKSKWIRWKREEDAYIYVCSTESCGSFQGGEVSWVTAPPATNIDISMPSCGYTQLELCGSSKQGKQGILRGCALWYLC
jgi:hypothetical protein